MDRVVRLAALFALAAAGTCGLSPAAFGAAAYETVPKRALAELKATVGQPFSAGLVFIDGKYLAPPYKVERFGTALRINGQQVSNQLIAWDEFLKTQAGAKIDRAEPEP
ncbi:MAG: hypothetical protein IJ829_07390, partial [Kiritimatiellae bacterium]|nr:hypothetical protein [Kiritimatiellia bacterium]